MILGGVAVAMHGISIVRASFVRVSLVFVAKNITSSRDSVRVDWAVTALTSTQMWDRPESCGRASFQIANKNSEDNRARIL